MHWQSLLSLVWLLPWVGCSNLTRRNWDAPLSAQKYTKCIKNAFQGSAGPFRSKGVAAYRTVQYEFLHWQRWNFLKVKFDLFGGINLKYCDLVAKSWCNCTNSSCGLATNVHTDNVCDVTLCVCVCSAQLLIKLFYVTFMKVYETQNLHKYFTQTETFSTHMDVSSPQGKS